MHPTLAKSLALALILPAVVISRGAEGTGRFKVFKVEMERDDQLKRLSEMEREGLVDVWRHPDLRNLTSDLMVDMEGANGEEFKSFLHHLNVKHSILVDDIESFLHKHWEDEKSANIESLSSIRLINGTRARRQNGDFGFPMGRYYGYDEIVEFMRRVETTLTESRARIRSIGNSVEGRQLLGIELGEPNNMAKRVVWIDGGIHAREWTSVHTAMYFINLIANEMFRGDGTVSRYLQQMNIIIFPCLNPDGYEYTRSNPRDALVRLWRKNRSMERCNTQDRCCRGVDLNRNFDFRFAETGTSYNPCSEIFHGAGAFSEPESQAVRDAVTNSNLRGRLVAFINMHAYSQLWIYPFSHIKHSYPADIADLVGNLLEFTYR